MLINVSINFYILILWCNVFLYKLFYYAVGDVSMNNYFHSMLVSSGVIVIAKQSL